MKIIVKKQIEEEITVELQTPAYFKYDGQFYKVLGEQDIIEVRPKSPDREWFYAYHQTGMFVPATIQKLVSEGFISSQNEFLMALRTVVSATIEIEHECYKPVLLQAPELHGAEEDIIHRSLQIDQDL